MRKKINWEYDGRPNSVLNGYVVGELKFIISTNPNRIASTDLLEENMSEEIITMLYYGKDEDFRFWNTCSNLENLAQFIMDNEELVDMLFKSEASYHWETEKTKRQRCMNNERPRNYL